MNAMENVIETETKTENANLMISMATIHSDATDPIVSTVEGII